MALLRFSQDNSNIAFLYLLFCALVLFAGGCSSDPPKKQIYLQSYSHLSKEDIVEARGGFSANILEYYPRTTTRCETGKDTVYRVLIANQSNQEIPCITILFQEWKDGTPIQFDRDSRQTIVTAGIMPNHQAEVLVNVHHLHDPWDARIKGKVEAMADLTASDIAELPEFNKRCPLVVTSLPRAMPIN